MLTVDKTVLNYVKNELTTLFKNGKFKKIIKTQKMQCFFKLIIIIK